MKNWCLEIWGDYACFTRPEMKVERVSYDVITPSSARSIYEAILWKPAIKWHITKIEVMNPIKWISVRRNEVGAIASERSDGVFIEETRQQRAGLFLRDVKYRIYGYFEFIPPEKRSITKNPPPAIWADEYEQKEYGEAEKMPAKDRSDETPAKYAAMFERRAKKGQCFYQPYLGCREFTCSFKLIEDDDGIKPINLSQDLGFMLYDMVFEPADKNGIFSGNANPEFFRAKLENGVLCCDRKIVEVRS